MSGLFSRKKKAKKKKKKESDANMWDNMQKMSREMKEEEAKLSIIRRRIEDKKERLEARGIQLDEKQIRDKYTQSSSTRNNSIDRKVESWKKQGYSEDQIKEMLRIDLHKTMRAAQDLIAGKDPDYYDFEENSQESEDRSMKEMMFEMKGKIVLERKLLRELEAAYDEALAKYPENVEKKHVITIE